MHPGALDRFREVVERAFSDLVPPVDDPVELAESAAALGVDVDTLTGWRADYAPASSVDKWRQMMVDVLVGDLQRVLAVPGPRSWRRWRITRRFDGWGYVLGMFAGGSTATDWSGSYVDWIQVSGTRNRWTGRRWRPVYVLGWPVDKWRCLLVAHHWPSPHRIGLGMCAKCAPCPECGRPEPLEHECASGKAVRL